MRLNPSIVLSIFLLLFSWACDATQETRLETLKLEECLLPENHPLHESLQELFKDPAMFNSKKSLKQAGFRPLRKWTHTSLMVARHSSLKGYLIKKFKNGVPFASQLVNYMNRIHGARALQQFIKWNALEHIVVPQKWLYRLPDSFIDPTTGESSYVLIVEDMNIYRGGNKPKSKIARKYRHIDLEVLKELCIVVYHFRGLDSSLRNMPFTRQGKIAFIDTEKWRDDRDEKFLQRAMPYLKQDRQAYALAVFKALQLQENPP